MAATRSLATQRYVKRLVILMIIYFATLLASVWTFRHDAPSGALAYGLAILPALPVIGVFWAVMRYIVEENDEFMRLLMVRQCLVATGFCLTIVTIREFLQNFDLISPDNGGFGAAFFWFIGLAVGALYNRVTMGTAGNCA